MDRIGVLKHHLRLHDSVFLLVIGVLLVIFCNDWLEKFELFFRDSIVFGVESDLFLKIVGGEFSTNNSALVLHLVILCDLVRGTRFYWVLEGTIHWASVGCSNRTLELGIGILVETLLHIVSVEKVAVFDVGHYLLLQSIVLDYHLQEVYSRHDVRRDVRRVELKSSKNEDEVFQNPAAVSEPLDRLVFRPFARFCIINLHRKNFSHIISSASQNDHQASQKQTRMLIPSNRLVFFQFRRSFYPIPSSISMSSQAPGII